MCLCEPYFVFMWTKVKISPSLNKSAVPLFVRLDGSVLFPFSQSFVLESEESLSDVFDAFSVYPKTVLFACDRQLAISCEKNKHKATNRPSVLTEISYFVKLLRRHLTILRHLKKTGFTLIKTFSLNKIHILFSPQNISSSLQLQIFSTEKRRVKIIDSKEKLLETSPAHFIPSLECSLSSF